MFQDGSKDMHARIGCVSQVYALVNNCKIARNSWQQLTNNICRDCWHVAMFTLVQHMVLIGPTCQSKQHRKGDTLPHTCTCIFQMHWNRGYIYRCLQSKTKNVWHPSAFMSIGLMNMNPLSKVIFTFPSWYLFAINPKPLFSLGWTLPPNLQSSARECDSWRHTIHYESDMENRILTIDCTFSQRHFICLYIGDAFRDYNSKQMLRLPMRTVPCPFANTTRIMIMLLSSTYLYA